MAKKKEPINLMPPEPKNVRIKNINRIFNSNFSQTFSRLEKNLLQELLHEKMVWDHSKSMFARDFQNLKFDPLLPLFVSVSGMFEWKTGECFCKLKR